MSYTETLQQTLHNTALDYNQATGDIVETEVGGLPIQIHALGAIITTAFVVTTSPVYSLFIKDEDRVTETEDVLTLTIPTGAAVGKVYINRGDLNVAAGQSLRVNPGGTFTIACKTLGVGSAGALKPFVLWRYAPQGDKSNVVATAS